MPLINCEINLILTWFESYFIIDAAIVNEIPVFTITDTKEQVLREQSTGININQR